MNLTWRPTHEPQEPMAAIGVGPAYRLLWERLRALPESQHAALAITANNDVLAVIGAAECLPWAPGVRYAAPCVEAPNLWLPTTHQPIAPVDLVARAILRRYGRSPVLLWPEPAWIIPLDRQTPLSPALLRML